MNPANSQEALSSLQQAQATTQDPNSILNNQRQQLGVNQAQDTVNGLRGAINNTTRLLKQVAPSVMGRTANSLVTNAQATRQIANEQAPIAQNLSDQGTQYNQAAQDLSRLEDNARAAASGIYQGQQDKLSYAQNLYNTLYQKEQDAAAAAESKRRFDAQQAAANQAFNYQVGSDAQARADAQSQAAAKALATNKAHALADVQSVLGKSNLAAYKNAVATSAARGNEMDKMKLELLQQLAPQLFRNSSPTPNKNYGPVTVKPGQNYVGTF